MGHQKENKSAESAKCSAVGLTRCAAAVRIADTSVPAVFYIKACGSCSLATPQ